VKSAEKGLSALEQFKKNKQDAVAVYQGVMVATLLRAPANGTNKLHVKDATGLTVGSAIYVVTETQPELPLVIQAVSGTMLTVDKNVPQSYRESELGRVYKLL